MVFDVTHIAQRTQRLLGQRVALELLEVEVGHCTPVEFFVYLSMSKAISRSSRRCASEASSVPQ